LSWLKQNVGAPTTKEKVFFICHCLRLCHENMEHSLQVALCLYKQNEQNKGGMHIWCQVTICHCQ
jgi:hypothetical protein